MITLVTATPFVGNFFFVRIHQLIRSNLEIEKWALIIPGLRQTRLTNFRVFNSRNTIRHAPKQAHERG